MSSDLSRVDALLASGERGAAIALVRRAAAQGDSAALLQEAMWHLGGAILPRHLPTARARLRQATQAGNQLLALQSQQLSDLIALISANGRADALTEAERATAAEQGRIQRERFLTPGTGYQPGNAQMFNNGNN